MRSRFRVRIQEFGFLRRWHTGGKNRECFLRFILDDSPSFLPSNFLQEFRRFRIQPSDMLLALTRPITNNQVKAASIRKICPMRCLISASPSLRRHRESFADIYWHICVLSIFKSAISAVMPQTLQPNLSPRDLAALPIPFPSLAEQKRIVAEVERRLSVVEELESMVSANLQAGGSIAAINLAESIYRRTDMIPPFLIHTSASALRMARIRQSILQKAFTGKLLPLPANLTSKETS